MAERSKSQNYISNLSKDLIGHALELIQHKAFPVYQRNIETRQPPFAHGEFGPSAIATLLLMSGIDYHLARLKCFRDDFKQRPPLPHTPYFNWKIDDFLPVKIERLLYKRTEKRLREQLIELTIMRDAVAHPKLYLVKQLMRPDFSLTKPTAKLAGGVKLRQKALIRKLKRSESTTSLRLPLVSTWISYVDIVLCVLVINRFLNLLEERYGNYYAHLGGFSVQNIPAGFFYGWGSGTRHSISFAEWAQAFFDSLAPSDKQSVQKRLGAKVSQYIQKRDKDPRMVKRGRGGDMQYEFEDPPQPEFLRKPPPWKMTT